jgi:hypothetical protein
MNLHRYTVSLDADDAVNAASLAERYKDKDLGRSLRQGNVFDTAAQAHARLAELIEQAEAENMCEPGHECGRCRNWPPQVYEVVIQATVVPRETLKGA